MYGSPTLPDSNLDPVFPVILDAIQNIMFRILGYSKYFKDFLRKYVKRKNCINSGAFHVKKLTLISDPDLTGQKKSESGSTTLYSGRAPNHTGQAAGVPTQES